MKSVVDLVFICFILIVSVSSSFFDVFECIWKVNVERLKSWCFRTKINKLFSVLKKKLFAEAYLHPKHRDYTFMFRTVSCNKVNLPADFVNNFMQNRNSKEMKNCSKKQIILSTNQNSYYMCNFFPSKSSQHRENSWYFFNSF